MSEQQLNGVEQEARSLGWVPQEEFRGDPSKWVDAETFVERGHTVMPILRKTNEKLEARLREQGGELQSLRETLKAAQESIEALKEVNTAATRAAVERARKDLLAELKQAKVEGNIDLEVQLTEELAELKTQQKAATSPDASSSPASKTAPAPAAPEIDPSFKEWQSENTWFGSDQRKTLRAMGIGQQLRADPEYDDLKGRAFYDKIVEIMAEQTAPPRTSKVAEARTGAAAAASSSKTYASLPPDAKAACDQQAKRLVGPGRAFKDVEAWRQHYATIFYQSE